MEKYCGVYSSPWKMYVDQYEQVNIYHNIQTNERIEDYKMKNAKLRQINEVWPYVL